jgi:hypothetical protein
MRQRGRRSGGSLVTNDEKRNETETMERSSMQNPPPNEARRPFRVPTGPNGRGIGGAAPASLDLYGQSRTTRGKFSGYLNRIKVSSRNPSSLTS